MKTGLAMLASIALAACSGESHMAGPMLRPAADPSAVIAAELAFAKLAQDKGQWTAFRATAAPGAVMFQPTMVQAQAWLKGRADPTVAVKWQPHQVWSSCDGSLAISHGAWQGKAGKTGYFTTVWQRQRDGSYKWIFDHGDALALPLDAPEMIAAKVADCPKRARGMPAVVATIPPPFSASERSIASDDGTLRWTVTAEPDGAHNFSAEMRQDGAMEQIVIEEVAAPEG